MFTSPPRGCTLGQREGDVGIGRRGTGFGGEGFGHLATGEEPQEVVKRLGLGLGLGEGLGLREDLGLGEEPQEVV